MKVDEIITYRNRKYKVKKITRTTKRYGPKRKKSTTLRAYLKPYGWNGYNRIGIIKEGKIKELEKTTPWGSNSEYYRMW